MAEVINNFFDLINQQHQKDFDDILDGWRTADTIQAGAGRYSDAYQGGLIFKQYTSLQNAFDELETIRNKPNPTVAEESALSRVSSDQYNSYGDFLNFINAPDPQFDAFKDITNTIITNVKELINLGGTYKNDRIIISEDKRGLFDFSLASQGLFRPIEFYSSSFVDKLKKENLTNPFIYTNQPIGVIPNNVVETKIIGSKRIFVYKFFQKEYVCERRQKGATLVFESFPNECILKSDKQGIILTYNINNQNKVFNGKGKIKLKYASNNKKSYLIYEKKSESTKYVDIFVPVSFLGNSDGNRILNILTPFLVSSALESFGIQTRISTLRLGSDRSDTPGRVGYVAEVISIPIKDYEDSPNEILNSLLNLAGKVDSVGSFYSFFKILNGNSNAQGVTTGDLGQSFSNIDYFNRSYMNEMMQRYKNWAKENEGQSFINSKVVNPNFQFSTFLAINRGVNFFDKHCESNMQTIITYVHQIMFMFYYYMDFLAIEFTPMFDFISSIMLRISEDDVFRKLFRVPINKQEKKDMIREYVVSILVEKYHLVEGGYYADNSTQIIEKQEKFEKKIKELNEALKIV